MTKAEAKAIEECCHRALRVLGLPHGPTHEESVKIFEQLRPAVDEIERVRDMASAELDGGK